MRGSAIGAACVVVALCVVGTLTVYLMGDLLDDDGFPEYTVTATGPDGTELGGTMVCTDTSESSLTPVLRFSFSVTLRDGTVMGFDRYLFMGSDGSPVGDLNDRVGNGAVNGMEVGLWSPASDPGTVFGVSADGIVLSVSCTEQGVSVQAQAVP